MADSFINLSQTDFEQVRTSLINYMRGKEEFSDYDFQGSALSTLIDLLAYNTAFFSTYTNFLANESFIDSAQKRDSLVSLARLVGYTPRSRVAARAVLDVTVSSGSSVPKGTVFNGSDTGYAFITIEDIELNGNQGEITVYQNSSSNLSVNTTFQLGKVTVPETADISSVRVYVDGEEYTKAERITVLSATSKVFFIDAIYAGAYEVSFGDGTYGVSVPDNSNVRVEYLTPNGIQNANGESNFVPSAGSGVTVNSVTTASYGGAERESAESIRDNAPSYFEAQNRIVTANDAQIIAKVDNPEIYDVTAWGGEENNPPSYGRLFLAAVKDANGTTFDQNELSIFAQRIQEKCILGILPEFVTPNKYYINVLGTLLGGYTITYNTAITSAQGLAAYVNSYIRGEDPSWLFNKAFSVSTIKYKALQNKEGLISIEIPIQLEARFLQEEYASLSSKTLYTNFANPIREGSITSNNFSVPASLGATENLGFIDDDGNGFIRFGIYVDNQKKYVNYRIGTVDYDTGTISVFRINWDTSASGEGDLSIYAEPNSDVVYSRKQATYKVGNIPNPSFVRV